MAGPAAVSPGPTRAGPGHDPPDLPPWLRVAFRLPEHLYRHGLGRLLGHRFLRLTHRGRRSGTPVPHGPGGAAVVVVSGFGPRADWLRNVEAGGRVEVTVGRSTLPAAHRWFDVDDAEAVLADYERRNPLIAPVVRRVLSWLLGWPYDGSAKARRGWPASRWWSRSDPRADLPEHPGRLVHRSDRRHRTARAGVATTIDA